MATVNIELLPPEGLLRVEQCRYWEDLANELYAALRYCVTEEGPEQEWLDRARAAIAKAEGKQ